MGKNKVWVYQSTRTKTNNNNKKMKTENMLLGVGQKGLRIEDANTRSELEEVCKTNPGDLELNNGLPDFKPGV